jgi:hypothetical protein
MLHQITEERGFASAGFAYDRDVLGAFYSRQKVGLISDAVFPDTVAEQKSTLKRPLGGRGSPVEEIDELVFEE